MTKTNEIMQSIASNVISMMKEHGTDWTRPWRNAARVAGQPVSARKRPYSGINRLNLGMIIAACGYNSPVFATFKQWKSLGATVTKGSKGHHVIFYKTTRIKDKETQEEKMIPLAKSYVVFNADQVTGWDGSWLQDDSEELVQEWDDHASADQFLATVPADVRHVNGNSAHYVPSQDYIQMPNREQFKDASGYYGTLFHELAHWSGHPTRLDRKFGTRFGSDQYAFEELIAELSAAMLAGIMGVDMTPRDDHAKYLNGWIKCLQDDPKAIQKAASQAEKAAQFVLHSPETVEQTQAA